MNTGAEMIAIANDIKRCADPLNEPLPQSDLEVAEIVAFLQSLTGDNIEAHTRDAFSRPIGDR